MHFVHSPANSVRWPGRLPPASHGAGALSGPRPRTDRAGRPRRLQAEIGAPHLGIVQQIARAHAQGKLIPLKTRGLKLEDIPAPYPATLNILDFGDEAGLLRTLRAWGVGQRG